MNSSTSSIIIESREHLIGWLGEAAEIEHNLMCCYLYAMFGLKRSTDEGLSETELAAVERWRKVIMGVALEEMNHLTLVANLTTAVGGSPHFGRPNFPTGAGPYPADLIMELAPFDLDTLDHFIYVERPENQAYPDGSSFENRYHYMRQALTGRLMPSAGDYPTVGSLYQSIRLSISALVDKIGEKQLFCGCPSIQIGPLESQLPGLTIIRDQASAAQALDTIVTQGEGASVEEGSHFARFRQIKNEYEELLKLNPKFIPGRPVARNPVMRSPPMPEDRVWVTEPLASRYIDMANAIYTLMLRVLVQTYSVTGRSRESKRALLDASYALMHSLVPIAETLTRMTANPDYPGVNAGMSFAMLRSLAPLEAFSEKAVLTERMAEVLSGFKVLQEEIKGYQLEHPKLMACLEKLDLAARPIEAAREALLKVEWKPPVHATAGPSPQVAATQQPSPAQAQSEVQELSTSPEVERADSDAISISFETKRCIHARHCVTLLPKVFKANTPGQWLFPDQAEAEVLAGVALQCPSGAIQYRTREARLNETPPEVNLIHLRENGPLAVHADIRLDGKPIGYRATLCRCGQSKNKPFCDSSHIAAKFQATGEPPSLETEMLPERKGPLQVEPTLNGPLKVCGNVEICCGTGRVMLRTTEARLCRCGHSKNKPLCDGSHVAAGFSSK